MTTAIATTLTTDAGFELAQRAGKLLAASTLVPAAYQNNLPNCVVALNMAGRLDADPLLVMQNLYIVHGRPAWSSQFLIATLNQSGRFTALRYEFVGEKGKDTYGCYAWAVERDTGEKIEGPVVSIQMAKDEGWYSKNGSKWKTMPDLMLRYRAATFFVRTYAPEISMGLPTAEEARESEEKDITPTATVVDMKTRTESVKERLLGKRADTVDLETGEISTPTTEPAVDPDDEFLKGLEQA